MRRYGWIYNLSTNYFMYICKTIKHNTMKLYHIKNSYGSDKIVIASDRSAFYSFRNLAGDISPLKKVYCDYRGWTVISYNGIKKGIYLNLVEIDYDREFSYDSLSGPIGISVMCDYESVKNWLDSKDCRILPGGMCRYGVSSNGEVFRMFDKFGSLKPSKIIGGKNTNGYTQIHFKQLDGSIKYVLIHRLVAYMFLNLSWDSKLDIDHINMNKNDNRLENIRACTRSENLQFFRDRVVKMYIKNGRDIARTARAMNITQFKVSQSLSTEGVK